MPDRHRNQFLYAKLPRHRALIATPPCSGSAHGIRVVHRGAPELDLTVMAHTSGVFIAKPSAICMYMALFVQICLRMRLTPSGFSTCKVGEPLTEHAPHGGEASSAALVVLLGAADDWSGDGRLTFETRGEYVGGHNAQARTCSSAWGSALVRFREPPHVASCGSPWGPRGYLSRAALREGCLRPSRSSELF